MHPKNFIFSNTKTFDALNKRKLMWFTAQTNAKTTDGSLGIIAQFRILYFNIETFWFFGYSKVT